MTPLRIGDRVSVERHEREKHSHRSTFSLLVVFFLFCFFFFYTIHESVLFGHSLWSLDRFLPSIYVGALFLFICFSPSALDKVQRDFDVTRDLLIFLCFSISSPIQPQIFFSLFDFFLVYRGVDSISLTGWGELPFFGSRCPQWTHLGACHALIITHRRPFFLSLSLSLG